MLLTPLLVIGFGGALDVEYQARQTGKLHLAASGGKETPLGMGKSRTDYPFTRLVITPQQIGNKGGFMSRFRHAIQNRDQHILTLRTACGVLVVLLVITIWGWMRAPDKLTVHTPPDLRTGSTRPWWEVPAPTVYSFAYYIFQQLNSWPKKR
ncbi:hypothetical protein DZS_13240 [Dickeya ananatis]